MAALIRRLTWDEIHTMRAHRHLLAGTGPATPPPASVVAARLAGIQVQVRSTTGLCLSARYPVATAAQVTSSMADPDLARVWAMRGTLHLVPAGDVHRYAAALGDSIAARETRLWPRHGAPAEAEDIVNDALVAALAGGPLPRDELATRVGDRLGPAYRQLLAHPWGIGLKPAVARGLVAIDGAGRTLTLRLPPAAVTAAVGSVDRPAAQNWLARQYLAANVAGTAATFAAWSGLSRGQARAALQAAADGHAEVDGVVHAVCLPAGTHPGPGEVRLVPAFDPFVLGVADKLAWGAPEVLGHIFRAGGWVSPVVLRAGLPVGVWDLTKGRNRRVTLTLFGRLDGAAKAAVGAESRRVADYVAAAGS